MAFSDTYRESIQSKHLANVGFTSTAKGVTNEANALKNPHQVLATQIPAVDVVNTYGALTASGVSAGVVEEHIVQLTADPTVNNNLAWLAYETDCTTSGHADRGSVRLDQWMRYAETQYKLRLFADTGAGAPDYSSEILPSYAGFNWEYDASAGTVYFDTDPSGAFTTPLWGMLYTYIGETVADKIGTGTTSSGAAYEAFKYVTDGSNIVEADNNADTLTLTGAGAVSVTATPGTDSVTFSADVYKTITDGSNNTVASGDDTLTMSGTGAATVTVSSGVVTTDVDAITSYGDGTNTYNVSGSDSFMISGSGASEATVNDTTGAIDISTDAFAYFTDGTTSGTASGADVITFATQGGTSISIDSGTNTVTISGSQGRTPYAVDFSYVAGTHWEYDPSPESLSQVPSDLSVYANGVLNKPDDAEYYTATISGGKIALDFAYEVDGPDWWIHGKYSLQN